MQAPSLLDTSRSFETPEGVDLQFHLAGPVPRALAWVIDSLFRSALYIVCAMVLSFLGGLGMGIMLIAFFVIEWFYPVLFEVLRNGQTPGKKSLGLQVIQDNGTPVSWGPSITRNLLRMADFLPLLYGFGLASMLLNKDFKRLGDLAAGTLVIYAPKTTLKANIPEAKPANPPLALNLPEQRAILDFAERSTRLSKDRQRELAEILSPITGEKGDRNVQQLFQYANWFHGSREAKDRQ